MMAETDAKPPLPAEEEPETIRLKAKRHEIAEALLLIFLISIVLGSLTEYAGRMSLSGQLTSDLNRLNEEVATAVLTTQAASVTGPAATPALALHPIREKINDARMERDKLSHIERGGFPVDYGVLFNVRNEFYFQNTILFIIGLLSSMASETLLANIAICCGGIGSVIAGVRRDAAFTAFRDLVLGMSSGFVVYVVLRGGKSLFLISHSDVSLNPYGIALCGLLTGLFSERAYGLLSKLVSMIERNLDKAFADGGTVSQAMERGIASSMTGQGGTTHREGNTSGKTKS